MYQFAFRLIADKRGIKDFAKLSSGTSFIGKILSEIAGDGFKYSERSEKPWKK